MNKYQIIAVLALIAPTLSGCAGGPEQTKPRAVLDQHSPVSYLPPVTPKHDGQIWSSGRNLRLYDDLRAARVGDIVTVEIVENSSANKTANTTSNRETSLNAGVDSIFGRGFTYGAGSLPALKASTTSEFTGKGSTDRSDTMSAAIACRVLKVLPSGNLYIKGSRVIRVNYEEQVMTLEGIIRTTDISPENSILSSHVADAKITYAGNGPVSDKQRPGWLVRLLDVVWPF